MSLKSANVRERALEHLKRNGITLRLASSSREPRADGLIPPDDVALLTALGKEALQAGGDGARRRQALIHGVQRFEGRRRHPEDRRRSGKVEGR